MPINYGFRGQTAPKQARFVQTGQEDADAILNSEGLPDPNQEGGFGTVGGGTASSSTAAIKANAAVRSNKAQRDYINKLLSTGDYRKGIDDYLTALTTAQGTKETEVKKQFGTAKTTLDTNYKTALGKLFGTAATATEPAVEGAYPALQRWLSENKPTAYAALEAAPVVRSTNALEQYMTARGVPTTATEAEASLQNLLGTSSATNFNTLVNRLKAAEANAYASRLAGAQMASTGARTALEAALTRGTTNLTAQEAAALAQIAGDTATQRAAAEKAAADTRAALLRTLVGLQ
jgi:hypothetical protein